MSYHDEDFMEMFAAGVVKVYCKAPEEPHKISHWLRYESARKVIRAVLLEETDPERRAHYIALLMGV